MSRNTYAAAPSAEEIAGFIGKSNAVEQSEFRDLNSTQPNKTNENN